MFSALLFDARTSFRQLHVLTLNDRKGFDTVSQDAIRYVLQKHGIPLGISSTCLHSIGHLRSGWKLTRFSPMSSFLAGALGRVIHSRY